MLYISILLAAFFCYSANSFSCKDQNNKDVDWFIGMKMPKGKDLSIPGGEEGYGYYYLDFNNKKFRPSNYSIDQPNQAVAYTLKQLYDNLNETDVFYTMYNDEPSKITSLSALTAHIFKRYDDKAVEYGHTKGVLVFNKEQGFWLVHSVPLFPPAVRYEYPVNGTTYGQNLLCLTFKYDQLSKIGIQLYFNHPKTYATSIPTEIASENPELALAVAHKYHTGEPNSSVIDLVTARGMEFKSFAKSHEFLADLYESLVAPTLAVGLNVETWKRGYEIELTCPPPKYPVYDVQHLQVLNSVEYRYTNDHAKFAVSRTFYIPWVCNGDINRMTTQFKRGGGTVCFLDDYVWSEYSSFLIDENRCE